VEIAVWTLFGADGVEPVAASPWTMAHRFCDLASIEYAAGLDELADSCLWDAMLCFVYELNGTVVYTAPDWPGECALTVVDASAEFESAASASGAPAA
jgi:hypothetical protein